MNINIVIVGTDYTNYAVVFACGGIQNAGSAVAAWVLSRNRTLDQSFVQSATNILKTQNLIPQNAVMSNVGQLSCKN